MKLVRTKTKYFEIMTDEIYCRSDERQPRSKGERGASSAMLRNAGVRQALARDTETGVSQGKWRNAMSARGEP